MSEWDGFENRNNEDGEAVEENVPAEENPASEVVVDNMPAEESAPTDIGVPYNNNPYGNNAYNPYGGQIPPGDNQGSPYNNNPYNNQYINQYNSQYNNSYNSSQYNNTPYNNNPYYTPYNNNPYNNNPYNNSQYNNSQYNNPQYGNNSYGGQIPPDGSQGSPYNNNPYNNPYSNSYNNQYGNPYNNPYSNSFNNQHGNPYNSQYNGSYNNNNPYSPYAAPPKKNKNGLIIGIVIGIVVLSLIAVFALIYRAVKLVEQNNVRTRNSRDEYQFDYDDDDWGINRYREDNDSDYDDYHDYDDWHDHHDYDDRHNYYNDDSQYYELHNDIREDLFYSADMDYYEYETDNKNVDIWAEYPIIQGGDAPNLDNLNDVIRSEVDSFVSYFEEEYEEYITGGGYYEASVTGYVTYMDEDKISVVLDERVYSDDYSGYIDFYLYCINIDMENGVVLENQNMLRIDDDFSVDFRERSDIQNGESYYISMMSDQEITDYFNSSDIIVFYTPMGMEIGFNYEEGWITVTYSEYEQYLKVF